MSPVPGILGGVGLANGCAIRICSHGRSAEEAWLIGFGTRASNCPPKKVGGEINELQVLHGPEPPRVCLAEDCALIFGSGQVEFLVWISPLIG